MLDSPLAQLQAANLYVFTMNNPVRFIDPSGLSARNALTDSAAMGIIIPIPRIEPPPVWFDPWADPVNNWDNIGPAPFTFIDWDAWANMGEFLWNALSKRNTVGNMIDYARAQSVSNSMALSMEKAYVHEWSLALTKIPHPNQRFIPAAAGDFGMLMPAFPFTPLTIEQAHIYLRMLPNDGGIWGVMALTESDAAALTHMFGGADRAAEVSQGGRLGYFAHYHPLGYSHTHIWFLSH